MVCFLLWLEKGIVLDWNVTADFHFLLQLQNDCVGLCDFNQEKI